MFGESIALKWSDIDFKNNTICVNKAAKATPKINEKGEISGRTMEVSGTKTACSVRASHADGCKGYAQGRELRA